MQNHEVNRNRDPRQRDRSHLEIRQPGNAGAIFPSPLTTNQPLRQEQCTSTNSALHFFRTLGLSSQLIQALMKANPQNVDEIQQHPELQMVNNAREFASFLSKSYGLDPAVISTPNHLVDRGNDKCS